MKRHSVPSPTGNCPWIRGATQQWRRDGEYHMYNPQDHPQAAKRLPQCGDYEMYKEFSGLIYGENQEALYAPGPAGI